LPRRRLEALAIRQPEPDRPRDRLVLGLHQVPVFRRGDGSLSVGVPNAAQIDNEGRVKLKNGKRLHHGPDLRDRRGAREMAPRGARRPGGRRHRRRAMRGEENTAYADVCRIAQNLGKNFGYVCFPCGDEKRPTLKGWPERASAEVDVIEQLWRDHAGPLIGIVTGGVSGIAVLDIDAKHPEARAWWKAHHGRLLPTRVYQTRSGGLHVYFRWWEGVRNSQGKLCAGVDTRGSGGYIISWFAAGFECLDHSPPTPWPDWLLTELQRTPPPLRSAAVNRPAAAAQDNSAAILRRVATAAEGERNSLLYWAANRLREHGRLKAEEAALIAAAVQSGLSQIEAKRTVDSAGGRA
jgi:hypothetical protein